MKFGRNTAAVMPERATGPDWSKFGPIVDAVWMAARCRNRPFLAPRPAFNEMLGSPWKRTVPSAFVPSAVGAPAARSRNKSG